MKEMHSAPAHWPLSSVQVHNKLTAGNKISRVHTSCGDAVPAGRVPHRDESFTIKTVLAMGSVTSPS